MKTDNIIEKIDSEINDDYSDDSLFNIASWGADLTFRELISMYDENELIKPELQRKYVWDKTEASRFVESLLLGLPVPSIFLALSGSQKLIIDGYQRIMTVYDYVKGIFSADGKVFKLSNSEKINKRWRNKAFNELSIDDQRKIKSTTIHAIIFQQKEPADDTSLYQIFERINTSGRTLNSQEIRNCVYQGTFNKLLIELNENEIWRILFGTPQADNRMRDMECILRFFAMKSDSILKSDSKQISLKKELNDFMNIHRNDSEDQLRIFSNEFITTITAIYNTIGSNAFRNYTTKYANKFHPAIYEAIMIAYYKQISNKQDYNKADEDKHILLLTNSEFKDVTTKRTTDLENILKRVELAEQFLFS